MIAFIDDHRRAYGVEPICKVLPIAPSTYHEHVAKRTDPGKLSARAKRDLESNMHGVRRGRQRCEVIEEGLEHARLAQSVEALPEYLSGESRLARDTPDR